MLVPFPKTSEAHRPPVLTLQSWGFLLHCQCRAVSNTSMTVTVKNNTTDLVVPKSVRRRAGIKPGDRLEFRVSGGIINIIPKLPSVDEYTPEQRRVIDAELQEAAKGPY